MLLGAGIKQLPSDEVGIDLVSAGGLELTSELTGGQLQIKPDSTTGATVAPLTTGANGAGVTVDNSTVEHNAGTIRVKDAGITNAKFAANVVESDGGLALDGANNGLEIKADSTTGATVAPIALGANGAGVGIDTDTLEHTAGVLNVVGVDGGTF